MIQDYSDPKVTLSQIYAAATNGQSAVLGACVIGPNYKICSYDSNGQAARIQGQTAYSPTVGFSAAYPLRGSGDGAVDLDSVRVSARDAELIYQTLSDSYSFTLSSNILTIKKDGAAFYIAGTNNQLAIPVKAGDKVELISPARFLFNAGRTPKAWNEKMLTDNHLKVLFYEEDASKIFANKEIKAGIAITYRDTEKNFGAIKVFTKYPELNSIRKKASPKEECDSLSSIIYTQNRFDLETLYRFHPEQKDVIGSNGKDKRLRNNIFEKVSLFTDCKKTNEDLAIIGVIGNKRCWRYIDSKYIDTAHENLKTWKVIVPRANGKGVLSDVLSTPIVVKPNQGYTQTFIGIGAFSSKNAAEAALKFIKTKFARALLCILKVDQHNEKDTWRMIPLQDFTNNSDIDWSKSIHEIDLQLYKKYNLSEEEVEFIETHVKEMA